MITDWLDTVSYKLGQAASGGGVPDPTAIMAQIMFKEQAMPKVVTIDGGSGAAIQTKNQDLLEELYINHANDVSIQCTSCPNLIKIAASGTIRQWFNQMCAFASKLTQIEGTIDFSAMSASTWYSTFANCFALQEIRIVPGSIKLTVANNNFQGCTALSDDSIVSISNGLDGSATGQRISLPNAIKTRCGQIVGTVADGVFTKDTAGSVTLTDFITTTKGWTLA